MRPWYMTAIRSDRSKTSWMSWLIEEDADAFALQLPDEVTHLGGLGRTERRRGLVHDQDAGVEMDGTGDRDGLALAAGERLDGRRKFVKFGFRRPMTCRVASSMAPSSRVPQRVMSSRPRNTLPGASMLSASASVW